MRRRPVVVEARELLAFGTPRSALPERFPLGETLPGIARGQCLRKPPLGVRADRRRGRRSRLAAAPGVRGCVRRVRRA